MRQRKKLILYLVTMAILAVVIQTVNHYRIHSLPVFSSRAQPFFDSGKFMVGVNYPWVRYGSDFGDSYWGHEGVSRKDTTAMVEHDFADLESQQITVVRWFLWANGHAGLRYDRDGNIIGLDEDFFPDVDAAIAIAKRHQIRIVFVLVDFKFFEGPQYGEQGHNWGGHAAVVTNKKVLDTFLNNAVRPLVKRYSKEKTVAAWEVVNEPEWEIGKSFRWGRQDLAISDMQSFIASVAREVHRYSNQPVTVGSLSRNLIFIWRGAGLDFYEAHDYPYTAFLEPLDVPLAADKPCLLGEFPTTHGSTSVIGYLEKADKDGYAGAFAWSYRAKDKYSNFAAARKGIARWKKSH